MVIDNMLTTIANEALIIEENRVEEIIRFMNDHSSVELIVIPPDDQTRVGIKMKLRMRNF